MGKSGELTTGEWHSFALVFDSGSVTAYIDGTKYTGSVKGTQIDQANGSPFTLGASTNFDTFYNGEIDEVSIWNKVLTQSEIQENLSTQLAGTEDGLAAYYNFDNDSGTSITDGRGSNNGTLINGNGNNLVGSNIGYTLTDWEVTETPVVKIAKGETEATITVSKIDDEIAESTAETITVTLNDSVDYDLDTNNQTATVTLNDDDRAGIEFARLTTSNGTVVATSLEYYNNTVVTSEVVEGTTFGVRLSNQPTDNVTLTLTIGDNTEGEFANDSSIQTLTFTSDNWDTYQEVTLYGVDDNEEDGNIEYSINVTASSSSDSNYNGITDSILVTNQDNEDGVEEVDEDQLTSSNITAYLKALNSETSEDGTTTAEVEISLSEAAPAGGMIVEYEILPGTADIGEISSNPLSILSFDQALRASRKKEAS